MVISSVSGFTSQNGVVNPVGPTEALTGFRYIARPNFKGLDLSPIRSPMPRNERNSSKYNRHDYRYG